MQQSYISILALAFAAGLPLAAGCGGGRGDGEVRDAAPIAEAPTVSDELYVLGQALFFDPVLSGNHDVSCATCHHPGLGTDDDLALSIGIGGIGLGEDRSGGTRIGRNAPALFNLHQFETMFWDGRVSVGSDGRIQSPAGAQLTDAMQEVFDFGVVSAQAMFPVFSREEMRGLDGDNELAALADDDFAGAWQALMTRLGAIPAYVAMFESAYPGTSFDDMTFAHAANAIAGFEIRAFERSDSPYQRYLEGDESALSDLEQRGLRAFEQADCDECHSGPLLTDFEHHNTGLAQIGPGNGHGPLANDDIGRGAITGSNGDRYAFRTPSLINVELTAPYGHAGQFDTLEAFIRHYRDPQDALRDYRVENHVEDASLWPTLVDNEGAVLQTLDRELQRRGNLDVDAIAAFLRATTADDAGALEDTIPESVPSGLPFD